MRRSLVPIVSLLLIVIPAGPSEAAPPVNDDFADALALSEPLPALAASSSAESTTETSEPVPSCIDDGEFGASVWYTFTPTTKVSAAVDTLASDFDTVLAIYTGSSLNTLTEIACNDNISFSPQTGMKSRAAALLQAGTTYRIQVSGILGDTGMLALELVRSRTTPGVVRGKTWFLNSGFNGTSEFSFNYGTGTDDPFAGAFLGLLFGQHGVSTPTTRAGNRWLFNDWFDADTFLFFTFGRAIDVPVAGDRDGDGDTDIGVVQGNVWHFDTDLDTVADDVFAYGRPTDFPLMGDWDGNGTFTPGVIRGNTWILNNGTDPVGEIVFPYGKGSDYPLAGDWDGDGDWTPGVVRGNGWFLNNGMDTTGEITFVFGRATDFPLVGDWDGAVE